MISLLWASLESKCEINHFAFSSMASSGIFEKMRSARALEERWIRSLFMRKRAWGVTVELFLFPLIIDGSGKSKAFCPSYPELLITGRYIVRLLLFMCSLSFPLFAYLCFFASIMEPPPLKSKRFDFESIESRKDSDSSLRIFHLANSLLSGSDFLRDSFAKADCW